jgi:hypothetical protein
MKKYGHLVAGLCVWCASLADAQPLRVAVLEFQDQTGMRSDPRLGGMIERGSLADRGVFVMGKHLVNRDGFTLIDRRDFLAQVERLPSLDSGRTTPTKPSFLHVAQALRADAVLRGSLVSFSPSKRTVNQGGYQTEFSVLSVRVALEALDAIDGAIIAVSDGVAQKQIRQTANVQTELGEDDILGLLDEAVAQAVPSLEQALTERVEAQRNRPTVRISVATTADPALVEVDGILVGTTPLENFEIYKGDHVLTIGKPGYRDVTKRILFEQDARIDVPMLRTELTADELKEVLESMRIHAFLGEPALVIQHVND